MLHNEALNDEKKRYFKSTLTQALDELLSHQKTPPTSKIHSKDSFGDDIDRASLELDTNLDLRIREREGNLIRKIRDALIRLENGTFGVCEQCGRAISENRLKVRPIATLCIKCKEAQEMSENMRGQ